MELKRKLHHLVRLCAALPLLAAATSCETIMDDLPPCETEFRMKFVYDRNVKHSDAFAAEVESVDLWVFDLAGRAVWHGSESGEALRAKDWTMALPLEAGTYDMVAWCGLAGKGADNFALASPQVASKEDLALSIRRTTEAGAAYVDNDLTRLYHGIERVTLAEPATGGTVIGEFPLTKDTNIIQVMLQYYYSESTAGKVLKKEDFDFFIEYREGDMNYDNSIVGDDLLTYRGWMKTEVSASFDDAPAMAPAASGFAAAPAASAPVSLSAAAGTRTQTQVNGLRAERTVGRLMADRQPILVIRRNSDNEEIVRLPLVKYLLMIKSEYDKGLTEQQFLDYEDTYRLTFFLDGNDAWYTAIGIMINKWVVVPPQDEEM